MLFRGKKKKTNKRQKIKNKSSRVEPRKDKIKNIVNVYDVLINREPAVPEKRGMIYVGQEKNNQVPVVIELHKIKGASGQTEKLWEEEISFNLDWFNDQKTLKDEVSSIWKKVYRR